VERGFAALLRRLHGIGLHLVRQRLRWRGGGCDYRAGHATLLLIITRDRVSRTLVAPRDSDRVLGPMRRLIPAGSLRLLDGAPIENFGQRPRTAQLGRAALLSRLHGVGLQLFRQFLRWRRGGRAYRARYTARLPIVAGNRIGRTLAAPGNTNGVFG